MAHLINPGQDFGGAFFLCRGLTSIFLFGFFSPIFVAAQRSFFAFHFCVPIFILIAFHFYVPIFILIRAPPLTPSSESAR